MDNHFPNELKRFKTLLLDLDKFLEGTNYEPHFEINLLCQSTHFDRIIPEMNKCLHNGPVTENDFKEVPFDVFKTDILEKIRYTGKPGPNEAPFAKEAVHSIESQLFQLVQQKFQPNVTKFYIAPHDNQWIFWRFAFLIVSKERNSAYLFEGGASD